MSERAARSQNPYQLSREYYSTHAVVARLIGRDKTVLDVGCNEGYLATLADPSNRFWGIEGMPQAAAVARERYVEVLLGNLNEYRDFRIDRKFDVIVLADVLEHLLSPLDVLSWVNGLLAPGGRVILSLPNIANWLIRLRLLVGRFDYEETGILDRTHLHFYTYSSARRMVADAGLNVISCRAGASVLGPLIAALPLTKSLFATSIVIEARKEAAT